MGRPRNPSTATKGTTVTDPSAPPPEAQAPELDEATMYDGFDRGQLATELENYTLVADPASSDDELRAALYAARAAHGKAKAEPEVDAPTGYVGERHPLLVQIDQAAKAAEQ